MVIAESNVRIDDQFKKRLMEALKNDDQYHKMIQKLEDSDQPNEIQVNERVYRINQGPSRSMKKDKTRWRIIGEL